MKKIVLRTFVSALALVSLCAAPAGAATINLGNVTTDSQTPFSETLHGVPLGAHHFADFFTFNITGPATTAFISISASDTVQRGTNPIIGGLLELYRGTVGSPSALLIDSAVIGPVANSQSATIGGVNGDTLTALGHYFIEISGTFNNPVAKTALINGSISLAAGVPEPSTWAMMLSGFAGLAFMAHRRRRSSAMFAANA